MFVILLRFSENKSKASEYMDDHNLWIKQGFEDGVFLLVGSLKPNLGGSVIAHNASISELQERVNSDPFVVENIVGPEILEVDPKKADDRLNFLIG
ncbi:MAG: YciI family protein [Arenicellales bacterium]